MNKLIDQAKSLGILFLLGVIVLKIVFYKESILTILRIIISFFWILVLPGFVLMYNWKEEMNFEERAIWSIPLSAAIIGVTSYYLGLIGFYIKYHGILLPAVFIIAGFILLNKKTNNNKQKENNENRDSK